VFHKYFLESLLKQCNTKVDRIEMHSLFTTKCQCKIDFSSFVTMGRKWNAGFHACQYNPALGEFATRKD
jgi:hypothetical protein